MVGAESLNELMSLTHQFGTEFIFSAVSCFCYGLLASSNPQFNFQGCSYTSVLIVPGHETEINRTDSTRLTVTGTPAVTSRSFPFTAHT
jgi:hypothetical protein